MCAIRKKTWRNNIIDIITICVATFGAILGLLSFINQFLIRFKPRIFVNNYFDFTYKKSNYIEVDYIILSLSISNSKNAYGIIEDLSIGIYHSDETSPKYSYIFPIKISDDNSQYSTFTPIIMPPKSSKHLFIKFGIKFLEKCLLNNFNFNFNFDVFCKYQNNRNWKIIKNIHLYSYQDNTSQNINFKILNFDISRNSLIKSNKNPFASFYKGNYGKWQFFFRKRILYYIKLPLYLLLSILETITISIKLLLNNFYGKIFVEKIITSQSSHASSINVNILSPDKYSIKSLNKISKIIQKKVNNKKISDPISYNFNNNIITLVRNNYSLKISLQGDSTIISKGNGRHKNKINFEYKYKKNRIGYKYWTEGKNIISKYRISLKLFDYFCMFSVK